MLEPELEPDLEPELEPELELELDLELDLDLDLDLDLSPPGPTLLQSPSRQLRTTPFVRPRLRLRPRARLMRTRIAERGY